MPRFECKKCGSLVLVENGEQVVTCTVCGKTQSVPTTLIDDTPLATRNDYDPHWEHYSKLLYNARTYKDIRVLTETAEEFDRLGDYQNSREMAEFCRNRITEEETKRSEKEERNKQETQDKVRSRRKYHIRMAFINAGVVALVILITVLYNGSRRDRAYEQVMELIDSGEYEIAIQRLKKMDHIQNSEELIKECEAALTDSKYNDAIALMNESKYGSAEQIFIELSGYQDSDALAIECKYQKALQYMEKGKHQWALNEFLELGDYKNSQAQMVVCEAVILETKYNEAVQSMNEGDYGYAHSILEGLNGYKDSAVLDMECRYQTGLKLMKSGNYKWALNEFEKILDYKDAADLAEEAKSKLE